MPVANLSSASASTCSKTFVVAALDWAGPSGAARVEIVGYFREQHRFVIILQIQTSVETLGRARCVDVSRNIQQSMRSQHDFPHLAVGCDGKKRIHHAKSAGSKGITSHVLARYMG